ncbi:hypothetical protein ASD93_11330 [Microbacterium sp. Root180]|nr:hypothetical protein ASD93_11330 [Microbacterium sp. Root180]
MSGGAKLPTVRKLASEASVSATTIMSMYARLSEHGYTTGEAGRGTFVNTPANERSAALQGPGRRGDSAHRRSHPWRRRALAESEARLRDRFPQAVDLMRGSPAARLLPLDIVRRSWGAAAKGYRTQDLEYPLSLAIDPTLADLVGERFAADGIASDREALVAVNSAQQCITLVAQVLVRSGEIVEGVAVERPLVAIEEPGYQTAMDTIERAGCNLHGLAVDERGVTPDALRAAVAAGVRLVVFTPRALSPTGATWSAERRAELSNILADARDVWVLEDDYFAELAEARPGSISGDSRLRDRVVHVRSFSKSIGPDLRTAVAYVGAAVRGAFLEERSYADGWTSVFAQRTLAAILADAKLPATLQVAADQYRGNRAAAIERMAAQVGTSSLATEGTEGLHLWVKLPAGARSDAVVEASAKRGVLVADGEPFFLVPGRRNFIRVNVGAAEPSRLGEISDAILRAIDESMGRGNLLFSP